MAVPKIIQTGGVGMIIKCKGHAYFFSSPIPHYYVLCFRGNGHYLHASVTLKTTDSFECDVHYFAQ